MFRVPPGMRSPVLVSSADGVGTKIKVAIESGRNDTVGHDLVNHCVNDILVQGAKPLFFLDYVAFGSLVPAVLEAVVEGVAAGCRENECALVDTPSYVAIRSTPCQPVSSDDAPMITSTGALTLTSPSAKASL